jgi:hypothetical protein
VFVLEKKHIMSNSENSSSVSTNIAIVVAIFSIVILGLSVAAFVWAVNNGSKTVQVDPTYGSLEIRHGFVMPIPALGQPTDPIKSTITFDPPLPNTIVYSTTTDDGGIHVSGAHLEDVTTTTATLYSNVFSQLSDPPEPLELTAEEAGFWFGSKNVVTRHGDTLFVTAYPINHYSTERTITLEQNGTIFSASVNTYPLQFERSQKTIPVWFEQLDLNSTHAASVCAFTDPENPLTSDTVNFILNGTDSMIRVMSTNSRTWSGAYDSTSSSRHEPDGNTWRAYSVKSENDIPMAIAIGQVSTSTKSYTYALVDTTVDSLATHAVRYTSLPDANNPLSSYTSSLTSMQHDNGHVSVLYLNTDTDNHLVLSTSTAFTSASAPSTSPTVAWDTTHITLERNGFLPDTYIQPLDILFGADATVTYTIWRSNTTTIEQKNRYQYFIAKHDLSNGDVLSTTLDSDTIDIWYVSSSSYSPTMRIQKDFPGEESPVLVVTDHSNNSSIVYSYDLSRVVFSTLPEIGSIAQGVTSTIIDPEYVVFTSGSNLTTIKREPVSWKTLSSS